MPRAALVAVLALALPAPAVAQSDTIGVDPNVAGRPATLHVDVHPANASTSATPQSVTLSITRGFKFDGRSRAERCTPDQARSFSCPEASRIGSGTADGHASGVIVPGGSQSFTAQIDAFLAPPPQPGDLAGVVLQFREPSSNTRGSVTGRLVRVSSGPFGMALVVDTSGAGQSPPPGVSVSIDRVRFSSGASRTVVRRRVVRRHGRRVRVRRRITYHLITNPRSCGGSWPYEVRVHYSDHDDVQSGALACRAG